MWRLEGQDEVVHGSLAGGALELSQEAAGAFGFSRPRDPPQPSVMAMSSRMPFMGTLTHVGREPSS